MVNKKSKDICKCGCERKYHEEGLGYCLACNPDANSTKDGGKCMSFNKK